MDLLHMMLAAAQNNAVDKLANQNNHPLAKLQMY